MNMCKLSAYLLNEHVEIIFMCKQRLELVQDRNSRELTSAYSVEVLLLLSENQGRHRLMAVTDVQIETEKEQMDTSC